MPTEVCQGLGNLNFRFRSWRCEKRRGLVFYTGTSCLTLFKVCVCVGGGGGGATCNFESL